MAYDLIIIGSGMLGSAAAYHASHVAGKSICLIGPPEPKCRTDREVFGSWYDEGRLCRMADDDHVWSTFALESMTKYRELEKESGINFYSETGFLRVTQSIKDFEDTMQCLEKSGHPGHDISKNWRQHFKFLNLPHDAYVIWEKEISGHISPRSLTKAHQKIAVENGVLIVPEVVSTITKGSPDSKDYRWDVHTEGGKILQAKKVLVATGAYAGFKNLFGHVAPNKVPILDRRSQTVAYLRISPEEAERLKSMPSMVTKCHFDNLDGGYILPPILYPNGKWYLKLGHARMYEDRKHTLAEVADWFRLQTGIPECVEKLNQMLCHIIPGLKVEEVSGDGCITAHTPDYRPYIDMIGEGFGVVLGGNGYAAKSCPEMGRLAARLVLLDEWHSEIARDSVKMKWRTVTD